MPKCYSVVFELLLYTEMNLAEELLNLVKVCLFTILSDKIAWKGDGVFEFVRIVRAPFREHWTPIMNL